MSCIHTCILNLCDPEDRAIGKWLSNIEINVGIAIKLIVPTELVPVRYEQVLAGKSEIKYNTEKQVWFIQKINK